MLLSIMVDCARGVAVEGAVECDDVVLFGLVVLCEVLYRYFQCRFDGGGVVVGEEDLCQSVGCDCGEVVREECGGCVGYVGE